MRPVITALALLGCLCITSSTAAAIESHLEVLSEVVSGPARGRLLALHLDASLAEDVRRAVVDVEAIRHTPHFISTLDLRLRPQEAALQADLVFSAALHVVLWLTPRPELLQALWLRWKPHSVLLFCLGASSSTDLLRHEALSGVENVALIGRLPAQAALGPDALGVYTVLPFADGVRLLGPWRREAFASWAALFPDRFPSFEGHTFHLATMIDDPPFLYEDFSAGKAARRGVMIFMMECFSAKFNFTYTLTAKSPDLEWGTLKNGSWSGVLGMIARQEKIFTINLFSFTEGRLADFDGSELIWLENRRLFLAMPRPLPEWLSLVRPLTPTVWALLLVMLILVVCFIRIGPETFGKLCRSDCNNTAESVSPCLVEAAAATPPPRTTAAVSWPWLQLYRAMVCQSDPSLPRALWQRVFLALWLPCCLVVAVAYTSNLVGIFTSTTYPRRLASLEELADSQIRSSFQPRVVIRQQKFI